MSRDGSTPDHAYASGPYGERKCRFLVLTGCLMRELTSLEAPPLAVWVFVGSLPSVKRCRDELPILSIPSASSTNKKSTMGSALAAMPYGSS